MKLFKNIVGWFDSSVPTGNGDAISWTRILPFIGMHLAVLAVFWVGFSWFAFWVCISLYFVRMFAISAGERSSGPVGR